MNKKNNQQSLQNQRIPKRKTPKKYCGFCKTTVEYMDYKNVDFLKNFLNAQAKILKREVTGTCQKHQKRLKKAIERARHIALLPFIADNFK